MRWKLLLFARLVLHISTGLQVERRISSKALVKKKEVATSPDLLEQPRARLRGMTDGFDTWIAKRAPVWVEHRENLGANARFALRVVAIAFFVRWFIVEPRYIPSGSMMPTFEIGDQLAIEKVSTLVRSPAATEVVLFRPPAAAIKIEALRRTGFNNNNEVFIKRVVGVAGDVVEVRDSAVFINGIRQTERFALEKPRYDWGPSTVPAGCLFVLGDNRNRSFDSHVWGFLPTENVLGHAILRYWPLSRFGLIEH